MNPTETDVTDKTDERSGLVTAIYQETTVTRDARIKDSINGEAAA